jgi:hypothetical protein
MARFGRKKAPDITSTKSARAAEKKVHLDQRREKRIVRFLIIDGTTVVLALMFLAGQYRGTGGWVKYDVPSYKAMLPHAGDGFKGWLGPGGGLVVLLVGLRFFLKKFRLHLKLGIENAETIVWGALMVIALLAGSLTIWSIMKDASRPQLHASYLIMTVVVFLGYLVMLYETRLRILGGKGPITMLKQWLRKNRKPKGATQGVPSEAAFE